MNQTQMRELFGVKKAAISKHLKNIFDSNELVKYSAVSKMETTAANGIKYINKDIVKRSYFYMRKIFLKNYLFLLKYDILLMR